MEVAGVASGHQLRTGKVVAKQAPPVSRPGKVSPGNSEVRMSDETPELPKKRRGRPPGKKAKRHDPDVAPIDGNEGCDIVFDKEPGHTYFLADQNEDLHKLLNRGAVVCTRDNETARPYYDQRKNAGESEIKVKDLVLMKMPTEQFESQQKQHRSRADMRMKDLRRGATGQVGGGLSSINTNFEDGGYHRQVI